MIPCLSGIVEDDILGAAYDLFEAMLPILSVPAKLIEIDYICLVVFTVVVIDRFLR